MDSAFILILFPAFFTVISSVCVLQFICLRGDYCWQGHHCDLIIYISFTTFVNLLHLEKTIVIFFKLSQKIPQMQKNILKSFINCFLYLLFFFWSLIFWKCLENLSTNWWSYDLEQWFPLTSCVSPSPSVVTSISPDSFRVWIPTTPELTPLVPTLTENASPWRALSPLNDSR